jgi:hypothetical protein
LVLIDRVILYEETTMKNQLTLLYFDNAESLLMGVDILQRHDIAIREIYTAKPIPGLEIKLRIKQLLRANAVLKYGCLGGVALTSMMCYFMQEAINPEAGLLNALLLCAAFLFAGRLFPNGVPKLFALKPGDKRYLMVVNTSHMQVNETLAHFFQYTGAVGFSPAIKNIVLS